MARFLGFFQWWYRGARRVGVNDDARVTVVDLWRCMEHRNAVVVGSGIMGRDIAALFLAHGWTVQVVDRSPQRWVDTHRAIEIAVARMGKLADGVPLTMRRAIDEIDWGQTSLAIETINESLDAKQALFRELDAAVPTSVTIASNSSGLCMSEIAEGCATSHRMANAHFFQPAYLVPLVEIVPSPKTHVDVTARLRSILSSVDCVPIVVQQETPGFLANRIQHALMREAFAAVDEGLATAEDVDKAVRFGFGFRFVAAGPMLLKEFAGFDTQHAAASRIYPSLCNRSSPGPTLQGLVDRGHLGVKSGHGLRPWTAEEAELETRRFHVALERAAQILRSDS
jgi:3-hydroxybutyryl-CoA dehydrogenase